MAEKKQLNWYRSPIDRAKLAELTKRRNFRPLIDILFQLGISVATAALALYAFRNWSWPLVVLSTYLHGSIYGIYGAAGNHELSHKTVFASRRLNEFFYRLLGFLNWHDIVSFRQSHPAHHLHTVQGDNDGEVMLPQSFRWFHWVWAFTINWPRLAGTMRGYFRRAFRVRREKMFVSAWNLRCFSEENKSEIRAVKRWTRFTIFGHAALAALFVATGNSYLILLVTFGPFFALWFKVATHMPQHMGLRPDVRDWRQSTRTYIGGPVSRFYYWNMNYHLEHHMYAAVPYYNLPKLRKEIEWDLPIATGGLIETWREVYRALDRQKQDSSYYFRPELPEGANPYVEPSESTVERVSANSD